MDVCARLPVRNRFLGGRRYWIYLRPPLLLRKGIKVTTAPKKSSPSLKDLLDKKEDTFVNEQGQDETVVKSVGTKPIDKTPAQLSQETPEETAERYGLDNTITDEDDKNPRVPLNKDQVFPQVASGTHLHPDIATDTVRNQNLTIPDASRGAVSRTVVEFAYADESPNDDKGFNRQDIKAGVDSAESSNIVDDSDDVPPNAGSTL
jgi:hypothetical protein